MFHGGFDRHTPREHAGNLPRPLVFSQRVSRGKGDSLTNVLLDVDVLMSASRHLRKMRYHHDLMALPKFGQRISHRHRSVTTDTGIDFIKHQRAGRISEYEP
jgi:hypothetical protein